MSDCLEQGDSLLVRARPCCCKPPKQRLCDANRGRRDRHTSVGGMVVHQTMQRGCAQAASCTASVPEWPRIAATTASIPPAAAIVV